MRLQSFGFDFPYIKNEERIKLIIDENRCSKEEAIKIDYQVNWKEMRRKLTLQTRCITALFERLFGCFDTRDCCKLLIEGVPVEPDSIIRNFSGVYTVQVVFDYDSFISMDELNKKKSILELLMYGIEKVASVQKWSMEPFTNVYKKITELGYKNEWVWFKSARSPSDEYTASVIVNHSVDYADIYIQVNDDNNVEVFKEKVISEQPDEFAYANRLGTIKWNSSREIVLASKSGSEELSVRLTNIETKY